VPAAQHLRDLLGQGRHVAGGRGLCIQDLEEIIAGDASDQGKRNEESCVLDLRPTKGGHTLPEGSDDGSAKLIDMNRTAYGRIVTSTTVRNPICH